MVLQFNGVSLSSNDVVTLYVNANNRLRHIHDALWKEEQHYTWLLYILIAGVVLALTTGLQKPWGSILAIILSLVGMFVCLIGFMVLSREREFFKQAKASCEEYAGKLGIVQMERYAEPMPGIKIIDWFRTTIVAPVFVFVVLIIIAAFHVC